MRAPVTDDRANALAHRDTQDMEAAWDAIEQAVADNPRDPSIAFIHAQIALETGRPSADLFERAQAVDPDNLMLARNHAGALAGEGRADEGIAMLVARLARHPDWIDGHKLITSLRLTHGDSGDAARSYAAACRVQPQNAVLRLAWFHTASLRKDWAAAVAIIDEGVALMGDTRGLTLARLFIASESGSTDPALFDSVAAVRDPGLDLAQVRFWLRMGDPARAQAIAARNIGTAAEAVFWPYLSLCWRLRGDERAAWLDAPGTFIRAYDLDFGGALDHLATTLRTLHTRSATFIEQSVRGGTQTDGNLFLHHDPAIQSVRAKVRAAVADYVANLPPPDPAHPLLGAPRGDILFEGSWSVRLSAQGFHACHTHSRGWISSALYVALPKADAMGSPPAGWLSFGTPPPELGLDLKPYAQIEPRAGRLVLFPSTMWHGTVPFDGDERLSIAFDVRRGRG